MGAYTSFLSISYTYALIYKLVKHFATKVVYIVIPQVVQKLTGVLQEENKPLSL